MPNNPLIHYKPGLTMDAPVEVVMSAADWVTLMAWFQGADTDGVSHLVYCLIAEQVSNQVYDQASMKAAEAYHAEHMRLRNPFAGFTGSSTDDHPFNIIEKMSIYDENEDKNDTDED